jgi:hypothetical protein
MRGFLDEDRSDDDRETIDRKDTEVSGVMGNTARGGFFFHVGERDVFVPFSVLVKREPCGAMMHTITVPEWWAKKEGLI